MTTAEAMKWLERVDDPRIQKAMGTDFTRDVGAVGAAIALRTRVHELETTVAKLGRVAMAAYEIANWDGDDTDGDYANRIFNLNLALREAGMERDEGDE